MFRIYDGRESFYQWDSNRKLIVSNPDVDMIHYCNRTGDCALVCAVYEYENVRVADVPNILLQTAWPIKAYAYCGNCYTQESTTFKVIARNKPADYVYTETEVISVAQAIENAVDSVRDELDVGIHTVGINDFAAGAIPVSGNALTSFNYTDTRFAATPGFFECTKEEPYSILPNPDCKSSANVYFYSNGKYLGAQVGFTGYIPDVTKAYKGTETITHVRFAIDYQKSQTKITSENIVAAAKEFTFTRKFVNPLARKTDLNSFDATAYGLPVLKLTGHTGCMTKDISVPLNYEYDGRVGECTLKWQGTSSLQYVKKNYTIKFDEAFEAAPGWGSQKKYCLKANYVDFTQARNVVSAKLWGQVVATRANVPEQLADAPNYGAVDGFPIVLYINDEYKGIYTFNIPKDAWTFNMVDGSAEAVVCAEGPVDTSKVLFKKPGVIVDKDYAVEYAPDEDDVQWIVDSLDNMISQLNVYFDDKGNIVSGMTAADMEALSAYIDWDSVIDYIIFTCLTNGYDGITKNHILLTYNGTKWYFSAYDMDCTFGIHGSEGKVVSMSNELAQKTMINKLCTLNRAFSLVRRHKKAELVARYNALRAGALSDDNVITTFTNFIADIPKALYDEECLVWKPLPGTATNNLYQIIDFYKRKSALLDAEIAAIKL